MAKKKSTKSASAGGRSKAGPVRLDAECRVVVLHGKEPHLRSLHTDALRRALEERFGDVERIRFGAETPLADILDECRSFGLLQQHKLVLVDEADKIVSADTRPALERYASAPTECATLVLRADTWRPGNLDKAIAKVGAVVKCDALSPAEAAIWAERRASKRLGVTIDPAAIAALIERVGTDLGRLDAELAKLTAMAGDAPVTPALVRESVGMTREEEVWVIQSRLLERSAERAIGAVRDALGPSKQPEALVSFAVIDLARKLHASARLLRSGTPEMQVARELKIWGESQRPILAAARRADPGVLADLFDFAVEADAKAKSGRTDPALAIETLAVRFAVL